MRFKPQHDPTSGTVVGYTLSLNSNETYDWSHDWPGSSLRGKRVFVGVDKNGLYDVSPEDADGHELEAIVTDFLPAEAHHLWPVWESDHRPATMREATNHLGEKTFKTYSAWKAACKKINPKVKFEGDKDICNAKPGIGEWDGDEGVIYKKALAKESINQGKNMSTFKDRTALRSRVAAHALMFEEVMEKSKLVLEDRNAEAVSVDDDEIGPQDLSHDRYKSLGDDFPETSMADRKLFTNRLNRGLEDWANETPHEDDLHRVASDHHAHSEKLTFVDSWLKNLKEHDPDSYARYFREVGNAVAEIGNMHRDMDTSKLALRRDIRSAVHGTPKAARDARQKFSVLKSSHQSTQEVYVDLTDALLNFRDGDEDAFHESGANRILDRVS